MISRLVVMLNVSGVDRLVAGWIGVIAARRPVIGRRVGRISRGCRRRAYSSSRGDSAIRISRAAIGSASVVRAAAICCAPVGGTTTRTSSRPRPSAARSGATTRTSGRPRSSAARSAAAIPAACRPGSAAARGATTEPACRPRERVGRNGDYQSTRETSQYQLIHCAAPLAFAGGGAADFNSTCLAPAGGWKTKSASVGAIEKFQSENVAIKVGWPSIDR